MKLKLLTSILLTVDASGILASREYAEQTELDVISRSWFFTAPFSMIAGKAGA